MKNKKQFLNRLLVATVGLPLMLFLFYLGDIWFALLVTIIVVFSAFELLRLAGVQKRSLILVMLVLQVYLMSGLFLKLYDMALQVMLLGFIVTAFAFLFNKESDFTRQSALSMMTLVYPGLALGSLILLREFSTQLHTDDIYGFCIIFLLYTSLAICDTLAYFFGTAYGKTKLAPDISPNKSWEGAIAGFMGSMLVVLIAWKYHLIPFFTLETYLVLGLITGIIGQIGDLFESRLKREAGVKDSSGLLFGHGGFLDRFDSLAFAAPLFWVYLHIAMASI
jgi:phosphatidate cytidylyltransferase